MTLPLVRGGRCGFDYCQSQATWINKPEQMGPFYLCDEHKEYFTYRYPQYNTTYYLLEGEQNDYP